MLTYTRLSYCKIIPTLKYIDSSMNMSLFKSYVWNSSLFMFRKLSYIASLIPVEVTTSMYKPDKKSVRALRLSMCTHHVDFSKLENLLSGGNLCRNRQTQRGCKGWSCDSQNAKSTDSLLMIQVWRGHEGQGGDRERNLFTGTGMCEQGIYQEGGRSFLVFVPALNSCITISVMLLHM